MKSVQWAARAAGASGSGAQASGCEAVKVKWSAVNSRLLSSDRTENHHRPPSAALTRARMKTAASRGVMIAVRWAAVAFKQQLPQESVCLCNVCLTLEMMALHAKNLLIIYIYKRKRQISTFWGKLEIRTLCVLSQFHTYQRLLGGKV